MAQSNLAQQIAELRERMDRLEGLENRAATQPIRFKSNDPHVTYSGLGPWPDGGVAWQVVRGWQAVLTETGERSAGVFNALANPSRLRIVAELMAGEQVTTADLGRRLDQPSTGQLFHHLKELLSAGVIYQPVRGTYAIRREHAVPLLTLLCAALDIREPVPTEVSS